MVMLDFITHFICPCMTESCLWTKFGFGPKKRGASLLTTWRLIQQSSFAASFQGSMTLRFTRSSSKLFSQLTGGWFFRAFKNHYGLKEHDIEFFAEHGEADTEHSNIGYELVEQFATTNETQIKVLRALQKGLSIWWAVTDGVVRECERRTK